MLGDERNAFIESLISEYYDRIYALINRRIFNKEQVKDLTQDTFLVALNAYEELAAHPNVGAWLMKTASNITKASVKKAIKEQERQIPFHINDAFTFNDDNVLMAVYYDDALKYYDNPFEAEPIWFLKYLKSSDSEILNMFYVQNMKISEIAGELKISNGTVKTRLSRARSRALKVIDRRQDS